MSIVERANFEPFSGVGTTLIDVTGGGPPYTIVVHYYERPAHSLTAQAASS